MVKSHRWSSALAGASAASQCEALRLGHTVRALVRSQARAQGLPRKAEVVVGDLARPETLAAAVDGIDAVAFTHGSDGQQGSGRTVDYGAVRNVLEALNGRPARIAFSRPPSA